ncbi:MAG: PTS sugar transporter subunit IIA [Treponema sp.]|nr:PTS sugar transporter subunit IIA [Treponema sp.]
MLSDFVKLENVILNLESDSKDVLFAEMVENLVRENPVIDRKEAISAIESREQKQNTCIMTGVAVPHASCVTVKSPVVSIGVSKEGIDYEVSNDFATDGNSRVHLVILILFEPGNAELHLKILAELAQLLRFDTFYQTALTASSAKELIDAIKTMEKEL